MSFTVEEIDYLDSKADVEARRARRDGAGQETRPADAVPKPRTVKPAVFGVDARVGV
jgi:hypothetical protein